MASLPTPGVKLFVISDKKKAKDMGLTAFAFCMLGTLFILGGFGASKFGVHNAPAP